MKRLIQLVRLPEIDPLPVMKCVFEELVQSFKEDDRCEIRTITSMDQLEDGGVAFLDDAAGNYKRFQVIYEEIGHRCPSTLFITWYWTDRSFRPFQRMLYTGEYCLFVPTSDHDRLAYFNQPDYFPLKLRASESPQQIGKYNRDMVRDYCYMGGGYKMDWIPPSPEFNGLYHRVIWDNYLTYEERRTIYLSSTFALGFQSDMNIQSGHLSQRLFEGLAYGCIVLCENPLASFYTDGAIVYVSSKEDLWEKMRYYQSHPQERLNKQRQGYEWSKKHGTNRVTTDLIKQKMKERYREEFNPCPVFIDIKGGLGNQLFQLATAYAYAKRQKGHLGIFHRKENGDRPVYWESLLHVFSSYLIEHVPTGLSVWEESCPTVYIPIPSLPPSGYRLEGYFQSSKYFKEIRSDLQLMFSPSSEKMYELCQRYPFLLMNRDRVVVMHCRRTDYLPKADFHGPLTGSYYREALKRMTRRVSNPIVILCGDDPEYWETIKEDISSVHPHHTFLLNDANELDTLYLLQLFPYFIMSNSTFIWWCAWLSNAKHVIAPSKWFGPNGIKTYEDIYESQWERVE
jgi:hypothetical protein